MRTPIAVLELVATSPDGTVFPLRASVGAPRLDESPSAYCCDVEVSLFESPLRPIHGEGSVQALCLALRLGLHLLAAFVERGGQLRYPDGEPFDLQADAIGQLLPTEPARDAR